MTALAELLERRRVVVLAGAGCSTESGIPDYRGPKGSLRSRAPIQFGEFIRRPEARARYWARSTVGWPRFSAAQPNAAHRALARLEADGVARGVITQNVDGLHQAGGSRNVVELHGSMARVRCMDCGAATSRKAFQRTLLDANAGWSTRIRALDPQRVASAPDADAELPDDAAERFHVPGCAECGGIVKPDVVFFGECVPKDRVDAAWRLFEAADALLVVGSSLAVYSGRRFIYRAVESGVPVAVVNLGPTRADEIAMVKVDGRLGEVLPALADALTRRPAGP